MNINHLVRRMKQVNPNVESGLTAKPDNMIELWWQVSASQRYVFTVKCNEISITNHEFQRAMARAKTDMEKMK